MGRRPSLGYTGLCRDFGIQLRYLQHGQRLALVHTIANIDIDVPDVTRDLAVNINILKGLESWFAIVPTCAAITATVGAGGDSAATLSRR